MPKWKVTLPDGTQAVVEAASGKEAVTIANQPPAPSVGSMAKAAGSGLVRGMSGVAGLPGDLLGLVDTGLRKAPTLLGYPEAAPPTPEQRGSLGAINSALELPTTQQVTSSVEKNLTGPLYEPKNTAEKYASTIGEFFPAAFSGPGRAAATTFRQATRQAVRRAVPQAVAPAVVSETAGQMTEGTPYEGVARFAGALAPSALNAARRVPGMPSVADMEAVKNRAYQTVDQLGVRYTPSAYNSLVSSMRNRARQMNISPSRHQLATSMLDDLATEIPATWANPGSPTLTELDQLRQVIYRDVVNRGDDANAAFGDMMRDRIDAFIDAAGPLHTTGMTGSRTASDAIRNARQTNTQFRKAELLHETIDRARRQAAVTGSGGNVENTMRQGINRILNNPARLRSFTAQEREIMQQIVDPNSTRQDVLRRVGKLSPQGNGLMLWLTIAGSLHDPTMLTPAAATVGAVSKLASEGMTRRRVNDLQQLVHTGRIVPSPMADAARQAATMTLLQGPRNAAPVLTIGGDQNAFMTPDEQKKQLRRLAGR